MQNDYADKEQEQAAPQSGGGPLTQFILLILLLLNPWVLAFLAGIVLIVLVLRGL